MFIRFWKAHRPRAALFRADTGYWQITALEDSKLTVVTVDERQIPQPGETVVAVVAGRAVGSPPAPGSV